MSLSNTREKSYDCFYYALDAMKESLEKDNLYETFQKSFVNWVSTFCLWHFDTIHETMRLPMYQLIQERIIPEFLAEYGDRDYYYNQTAFDRLALMKHLELPEYMLAHPYIVNVQQMQKKNRKLTAELARIKKSRSYRFLHMISRGLKRLKGGH